MPRRPDFNGRTLREACLDEAVAIIAESGIESLSLRDVARRLGVSHATAIKAIARLKREGLATSRPYRGVFLTEEGQALARRVRARHRLVVDVLLALGGLDVFRASNRNSIFLLVWSLWFFGGWCQRHWRPR